MTSHAYGGGEDEQPPDPLPDTAPGPFDTEIVEEGGGTEDE